MKSIVVLGYQHSGTSIVRRIIGSHPDVWEVINESTLDDLKPDDLPVDSKQYSHLVCKFAISKMDEISKDQFSQGDKRVLVIRDLKDVIASLKLRYGQEDSASLREEQCKIWGEWASYWRPRRGCSRGDDLCVRYEDLFDDGRLASIFEYIGLPACPKVLAFMVEHRVPINCEKVPDREPSRTQQEAFRSWQINQRFYNRNGENIYLLSEYEHDMIEAIPLYQELYMSVSSSG